MARHARPHKENENDFEEDKPYCGRGTAAHRQRDDRIGADGRRTIIGRLGGDHAIGNIEHRLVCDDGVVVERSGHSVRRCEICQEEQDEVREREVGYRQL